MILIRNCKGGNIFFCVISSMFRQIITWRIFVPSLTRLVWTIGYHTSESPLLFNESQVHIVWIRKYISRKHVCNLPRVCRPIYFRTFPTFGHFSYFCPTFEQFSEHFFLHIINNYKIDDLQCDHLFTISNNLMFILTQ